MAVIKIDYDSRTDIEEWMCNAADTTTWIAAHPTEQETNS